MYLSKIKNIKLTSMATIIFLENGDVAIYNGHTFFKDETYEELTPVYDYETSELIGLVTKENN